MCVTIQVEYTALLHSSALRFCLLLRSEAGQTLLVLLLPPLKLLLLLLTF